MSGAAASPREPSSRARAARFTLPRPSVGLGSAAPVTQPPAQRGLADAREKATLGPRRSPGWGSLPARALRLPKTGPAGRRTADPRRRSGNASPCPRSAGVRGASGRGRARACWSAASSLPERLATLARGRRQQKPDGPRVLVPAECRSAFPDGVGSQASPPLGLPVLVRARIPRGAQL